MSAEPNSEIYKAAREIAGKALGQDISPAVGAIDPSIFELINLIAEWIIKIIQQLQERFNPDQAVAIMRRPTWLYQRRIRLAVRDGIIPKYRSKADKVAAALLEAGERMDAETIKAGFEELSESDFVLV